MTTWNSAFAFINGINMHYLRTGGQKPPVVLLHGLMTSGECWTLLAESLEQDYDVIMPDARGHGRSDNPLYGYSYQDHATDVINFITSLEISTPVLLGHSMGGLVATLVAAQKPGLINALILADPTFISPAVQRQARDSGVADQHRQKLTLSIDQLVEEALLRNPHRPTRLLKMMAQARLQTSMAAFDILTPPNPDYLTLLKFISIPTLLLTAENGVVAPPVVEAILRVNKTVKVEQIKDAGHGLQFDQVQRFSEIVRSFLLSLHEK